MWKHSKLFTIVLLTPIIFSFALAMDIYMPMLNEVKEAFGAEQYQIQITLSIFIFIAGFGQLIFGPMTDAYGRRKVILISIFLYAIGSLLCGLSINVYELIGSRVLQAFGACGTQVVAFAIVRDGFEKKDSAQIYSLFNGMVSFSPTLAPMIGVGLYSIFGSWKSSFFFLFGMSMAVMLLMFVFVHESLAVENRQKIDKKIFKSYLSICKNIQFLAYSSGAVVGLSAFFTFFSMAPDVINKHLGLTKFDVAYYFGMGGLSFFVGCILATLIVGRIGVYKTAISGICLIFFSGILMLAWHFAYGLTIWGFVAPSMFFTFGCALSGGAGAAGALEQFKDMAGKAAAVFGSLQFGLGAIIGSIVMLFPTNTTIYLAIEVLLTSSFSYILFMIYSKKHRKL